MMRKISIDELLARMTSSKGSVVVSLASWDFHVDWEPEVFRELRQTMVAEFSFIENAASGEVGRLGYFLVPENVSNEALDSLARHPSVRLFVSSPDDQFFNRVPKVVRDAICARNELSSAELSAAASMSGFEWLALRDGDEGDSYYYLLE